MSLIHQALKKLEGADHPASEREYSFRKPGIRAMRPAVLPVLVFLSIVSVYFLYSSEPKRNMETTYAPPAARTWAEDIQKRPTDAPEAQADFNSQGIDEYRADRFDKAEALFRKAALARQASAAVHSNLGLAAMRLGRKSEAEASFKKALELDPGNPQALNNHASLLAEAGKTSLARAMFEKAIKADPVYADAHFNLAVLLEKKGELEGALAEYEKFLDLESSEASAAQVRKKLMALRSEIIVRQAGGH